MNGNFVSAKRLGSSPNGFKVEAAVTEENRRSLTFICRIVLTRLYSERTAVCIAFNHERAN